MAERRALIEGLKPPAPPVDPNMEKAFVFGEKKEKDRRHPNPRQRPHQPQRSYTARVPFSTRMRADFAAALKRASLERQLAGIEPNTLQDILGTGGRTLASHQRLSEVAHFRPTRGGEGPPARWAPHPVSLPVNFDDFD